MTTLKEYQTLYQNEQYGSVLSEVLQSVSKEYSRQFSERNRPFAIGLSEPNLITIARVPLEQKNHRTKLAFLGLHFDIFGEFSISQTHKAENRIVINLGRDNRYLLYVNLPIEQVNQYVYPASRLGSTVLDLELANSFFERYPDYPVVRVEVRPGEAYIAPASCVIHDGSCEGSSYPDVSAHFLGDFSIL